MFDFGGILQGLDINFEFDTTWLGDVIGEVPRYSTVD